MLTANGIFFQKDLADSVSKHENRLRRLAVLWEDIYSTSYVWDEARGPTETAAYPRSPADTPLDMFTQHISTPLGHKCATPLREFRESGIWDAQQRENLKGAIREALGLDSAAEIDEDDENLFMQAWGARHEQFVACQVRYVAERCEHLEDFDWWVAIDGKTDYWRWHWTIQRDALGSVRSVSGVLTWTGCNVGSPPPLLVMVGEELQYASDTWESASSIPRSSSSFLPSVLSCTDF